MEITDWLTVSEVARLIPNKAGKQSSRAWIHKLREAGEFPNTQMIGSIYLLYPLDVQDYLIRTRREPTCLLKLNRLLQLKRLQNGMQPPSSGHPSP